MKKILITGKNSYIGTSFKKWLSQYPNQYNVDTISLRDNNWKTRSFEGYDVVLHTVGIAHVDASPEMEPIYYEVNRDLTIEAAKKAKESGVNQFIFMSSIIVYGDSSHVNKNRIIDENTIPTPSNFYGNSKLQAEEGIRTLQDVEYKVVIIRPPMIYGKGSKGNYPKLAKLAQRLPVFPDINNQRSMLHIDNLCEFIKLVIDNHESGIFFPQNSEYVNTSQMVKLIANAHGKKIRLTNIFNPILIVLSRYFGVINKVFGSLVYDQKLSYYKNNYAVRNLKESIMFTENKN